MINEDLVIYHHDVKKWIENHLHEIPECFRDIFIKFVRYCKRHGLSELTIYNYLPRVREFLKFLYENGVRNVKEINEDLIIEFFDELKNRELSELTIKQSYGIAIKKFLRFLMDKKLISEEVYKSFKKGNVKYLPPTIKPELIKLIDDFIEKLPLKYKVIYYILRETGARIGEVLRIKLMDVKEFEDLNGVKGFEIILRRSKSRPRTVFIIQYYHIVKSWIDQHPCKDNPNTYLIYGCEPTKPLTRSSIPSVLIKVAEKFGSAEKYR